MKRQGLPTEKGSKRSEAGFTILELMMAMFVFAVIMGAVAAALGTTLSATRNNGNRVIGANLAAEDVDSLRLLASTNFTAFTDQLGQTSNTRQVGNVDYTVTRNLTWVNGSAGTAPCDGASVAGVAYVRVTSEVSWPLMGAVKPPTSETVIAPPAGVYRADRGNIGVKVTGADDSPRTGVSVTVTGPSFSDTQTTGADGCVFFAFLNPAGYTVQISKSGYADLEGTVSPTKAAGVTVATTTQLAFNYDLLGQLEVEQRPLLSATGPVYDGHVPTNAPLTLFNTVFQPIDTKSFPGTGTTRLLSSLYPHPSGYPAWAGSCSDADPDFYKLNPADPSLRAAAFDINPGAVTNGFVDLPAQRIRVKETDGDDVDNVRLQLVHVPGPGCATGETIDYHNGSRTDHDGRTTIAAPYGTWQVRVVGRTTVPATGASVTLSPNDSEPRSELNVTVL